jgi:glycerol-3-phosphate acyltransferase PlsX
LVDSPVNFVGNVEGHDLPLGGRADVIVTDAFSGNVLLKGVEGAVRLAALAVDEALAQRESDLAGRGASSELGEELAAVFETVRSRLDPDSLGGATLLGVPGVVVVAHGAASAHGVASAIAVAAQAVREGLVPRVADALAGLVARRRSAAGLVSAPGAP